MKTIYLISLILVLGTCTKPVETPEPCIDGDGNLYPTIQIGRQLWMQENLRTTKFNNGDAIKNETDLSFWWEPLKTKLPYYCWPHNDSAQYARPYGAIYNGFAVVPQLNGSRNICPAGWHVPSEAEWKELLNYLGGLYDAGGKLKEVGTAHWLAPNLGATNSSGFTAISAADIRTTMDNTFHNTKGEYATFLSSTLSEPVPEVKPNVYLPALYCIGLKYDKIEADNGYTPSEHGNSVRCICDVKFPAK